MTQSTLQIHREYSFPPPEDKKEEAADFMLRLTGKRIEVTTAQRREIIDVMGLGIPGDKGDYMVSGTTVGEERTVEIKGEMTIKVLGVIESSSERRKA